MNNFQKITNEEQWQGLLKTVKFKTFFHSFGWESFLEKEYKWLKFSRYIYKNKALLSLAVYKSKLVSHPFCEYGGLLPLEKGLNRKVFASDFKKQFKQGFKIKFHPVVFEAESSRIVSYWIEGFNKKTVNDLWAGFRKTTKQEIKKAQKQNISVGECKSQKDLKAFYSLYLQKAKDHKIPAYPKSFFEFFFNSKQAEIVLAKQKGKVIAGSVFLFYNKFLHYFINASKKQHYGANHLILHETMQKYIGKDFEVFDFGGTKKASSLCVFKKGFGTVEKPIYIFSNQKRKKAQELGFLRKAWGLLPKTAIKVLSPYFLQYKL